jgi:hypothetical protein
LLLCTRTHKTRICRGAPQIFFPTTETEAVIKALEQSEVTNSLEENFRFTANHDHYFESFNATAANMMFQWQAGGVMAIVYPEAIMEETGATYKYPPWAGPWK